ncbi:hypothetical protein TruAng_000898 [Truncatella angustata]|nr:hypothetical protein TruAng_000898 [Truncatella angustata]
MHSNHYASDVVGGSNFTRRLAENCCAISNNTPFSEWDPRLIDVTHFTKDLPEEALVDGPPLQQRHADHPEQACVVFHLPLSKAAQLKEMAIPWTVDLVPHQISTFDATCAYIWRMLSKVRAPLYRPDLSKKLWWAEAVDVRGRLESPPFEEDIMKRMMRNILASAFSDMTDIEQLTAAEVISDAPLAILARYIRRLTNSCTQQHLESLIDAIAKIRDKRSTSLRVDARPPMSMFVTDHRKGDISSFDFGFAKPITYRHLWGSLITTGLILIYAPICSDASPDEVCMFTITKEKELVPKLLEDPEWTKYFEYRGVD